MAAARGRRRCASLARTAAAGCRGRDGAARRHIARLARRRRTRASAVHVVATEMPGRLALGGLVLAFRVDRVDALADGGLAIIDYKSGHAPGAGASGSPRGRQARRSVCTRSRNARAAGRAGARAVVRAAEGRASHVNGLAADAEAWPALRRRLAKARHARDVGGSRATLARAVRCARARTFRAGEAAVAPRDARRVQAVRPAAAMPRPGSATTPNRQAKTTDADDA